MKKSYIIIGILALIVIYSVSSYNSIIGLEEGVKSKWSEVESQYQRRMDLIPNLVEIVKGYASHEKETLEGVVKARAEATNTTIDVDNLNSESLRKFQAAQDGLSSAMSRLMVVVERYPDLKANQNFMELNAQWEGTENRVSFVRDNFIKEVEAYNSKIRRFPTNLMAGMFGFERIEYFKSTKGAEIAPSADFSDEN